MKILTSILLGVNILSAAITCHLVNTSSQQIIKSSNIGFLCMEKDINQHFEKFGNAMVDLCNILQKDIDSQQNTNEFLWEKIQILHGNMQIINDNIKLLHTYRG